MKECLTLNRLKTCESVAQKLKSTNAKKRIKNSFENTHQALDSSADAAEKAVYAQKKIDKAVTSGLIHKNKASRKSTNS